RGGRIATGPSEPRASACVGRSSEKFFVCRATDRRRRAARDQTLSRDAHRQAAVAVHFRARATDDAERRQLLDAGGRGECRFEERTSAHAAALMRVLPGQHWRRSAHDAGLSWAPRSEAYGALHARGREEV